jgi:methyl-accepting chemotaxis protein
MPDSFPAYALLVLGLLLFVLAIVFSIRGRAFTWPTIAVIGVAMLGIDLPAIKQFALGKDGLSVELRDTVPVVAANADAINLLKDATTGNADQLKSLQESVAQMNQHFSDLIARQNDALASLQEKGPPGPAGTGPAAGGDVSRIQRQIETGRDDISQKLGATKQSIDSLAAKNAAIQSQVNKLDALTKLLPKY